MKKLIQISIVLGALFAFGCSDGGGGGPTDDGGTDAAPDSTTPPPDAGPDCVEDPTTLRAHATFETNLRFLNQCTTSEHRDFDNAARIQHPLYVPGGPYPAF